MKIYNTLTRQKEDFTPVNAGKVSMYVCGPTVYNYIHIGNARPMVAFDAVRRYLEYKGFEVALGSNFTDVDDKIIAKANAEGVTMKEISDRYIAAFFEDSKGLNVLPATFYPRVTDEMGSVVEMTQTLINKGFAYEKNGTVYFSVDNYEEYGKLSRRKQDDEEAGARIEIDTDKRNPLDFVIWKPAKPGEPYWESPWGNGRPGWHIECSVMAKKYLGDTIDIHAGGGDLIFPHHENEIAQSECANGCEFTKYWMHNGLINISDKKLSKSNGNFSTLREIADQHGWDVIRFWLLSVHYRSPINFSKELLEAAGNGLDRIKNCLRSLENASQGGQKPPEFSRFRAEFEDAMDNDFNTANAITAIFDLVKFINLREEKFEYMKEELLDLCGILGLPLTAGEQCSPLQADLAATVEELIEKRRVAKEAKDWAAADAIRAQLTEMGVVIKDTKEGTTWHIE